MVHKQDVSGLQTHVRLVYLNFERLDAGRHDFDGEPGVVNENEFLVRGFAGLAVPFHLILVPHVAGQDFDLVASSRGRSVAHAGHSLLTRSG